MTIFKTPYSARGFAGTPYNGLVVARVSSGDGGKQRSDAKGWIREFVLPNDMSQRLQRAENAKRAALIMAAFEADED